MFVMISEKLRRELEAEVSVWVNSTVPKGAKNIKSYKAFLTKMLVEYEANKKGFTQYKESASYPIV